MRCWQALTLKNLDFIAINIRSYWRCLRRKATEPNLSSKTELKTVVWRMNCTEMSEETSNKKISEQLREERTNLRFLKFFAFYFLSSNFFISISIYIELWCSSDILSSIYIYILELILNIYSKYVL